MTADQIAGIFARLTFAYGTRFMEQWGEMKAAQVKAAWLHELQGITTAQTAYALAHLPGDFPVNAMQFRDLARSRPLAIPPAPRLGMGGAVPTPNERRRLEQTIAPLRAAKNPKAWAHAMRWREENGLKLSAFQQTAWRAALGVAPGTLDPPIHRHSEAQRDDLL